MLHTFLITLLGYWRSSFKADYHSVKISSLCVIVKNLIIRITRLENTAKKIQDGEKVNYVKIFFIEHVSSQTEQSCEFYK